MKASSELLEKARIYEAETGGAIGGADRPSFHLTPYTGWMNDPNGFSYYRGKYHLFYQYHPYDSHWGPMHWGHAVSKDLLTWKHLPAALAPDQPYDSAGCFSGSALTMPDGKQLLIYTGVQKETLPDGMTRDIQRQCVAVGDGMDYEKYAENPVLNENDLPQGGQPADFRDPKIFPEPDGTYSMIAVNRDKTEGGQVLRFLSSDAFHWEYAGKVIENHNRLGLMWECPDLFHLQDTDVLLISAQEMLPEGLEYHNGFGNFCILGRFDKASGKFTEETSYSLDYGIDFYAAQTVLAPDGRRIMIGWLQNWDTVLPPQIERPWFGQMSLPRELSIRDGRLIQTPIRELEKYRTGAPMERLLSLSNEETEVDGISGRHVDMELLIEPADVDQIYHKFTVRFAKNDRFYTSVSFRPRESVLRIDRKFSGSRRGIIHQRRASVRHINGKIKLRLILDLYSVEIFVNDGEQVLSAVIVTEKEAERISFFADGDVNVKVLKYALKQQ